ncbi:MAG TPA: EAL domain-containing protein, partial [Gammaproteobacteria bacterium]|nr:EAL domain-containing protein [Gammaproteobacteria bacterium]
NRSAQAILGRHLDQLQGRTSIDPRWRTVHEDGSPFPGPEHPSMTALRTGRAVTNTVMAVHNPGDDRYHWLLVNAFPESDPETRQPVRVFTTFEDITDLKAARDELQRERDRIQRYLDVAGVMLLALNRDGRVALINRFGLELLGYQRREEVEGRDWFENFLPDSCREAVRTVFNRLIAGDVPPAAESYENPVLTRSGQELLVRWTNTVVRDERGRILQTLTSGMDVTEQREVEAGLLLRKRALEATVNGILITDAGSPENRITYVNPAFERITGYSAEEALGRDPGFLQGSDRDQPAARKIARALREHHHVAVLLRNYRKDGSLFWNELHIAPVKDEKGQVTNYVGVINDLTEHKRYEQQLEHQATHDDLTGLPNRNLLRDRLNQALVYGDRHNQPVGVLLIDLDQFKLINDSLGHDVGDQVLCTIAERLEEVVRPGDTVARQGGDEFVLVLMEMEDPQRAEAVAAEVLRCISEPLELAGQELRIGASIGVSLYPRDGADAPALLRNADAAMYQAKDTGRSHFHLFTADLERRATERLTLGNDLRRALEESDLDLYYQPQIDARTGAVTGFEALSRWLYPDAGEVPPDRFIPIAAESGLTPVLGEWVLWTACRQLSQWHQAGFPSLTVAVNVSGQQLRDQDLAGLVARVLEETGIPASQLELELTESEVMQDPEKAAATLERIKALGVQLAIDDFGTGYSSLAHLKRFAFDRIKIDRTFVREVTSEPSDAAIVRTIIATARALKLVTVAEGVETEAQQRYLQRQGCDILQGFRFAPGLSAADAGAFLEAAHAATVESREPAESSTVLVVEEEEQALRALERRLQAEGYRVLTAGRPADAFELLARYRVQVVVADQGMTPMSGIDFLNRVKEIHPEVIRLVLGGEEEEAAVAEAVDRGWVYSAISRPWDEKTLLAALREAFEAQREQTVRDLAGRVVSGPA